MPQRLPLFLPLLALLTATPLHAGTYHVSPSGSDGNPGTPLAPFRTIARGISALASGDTLLLGAGTYVEGDLAPPSGTTIKAAPGAKPVIQPNGRWDTAFVFGTGRTHITLDGLVIDGGNASGARVTLFPIATVDKMTNSHNKILNSELKHGAGSCFLGGGSHWEIRNNYIHHCGNDTTYDHGLYFHGEESVIANNRFEHNACYHIQNYPSGSRNTYDSNVFTGSGCGVTLPYGNDHRFLNNLMYDDASQLTRGEHGVLGWGSNTVVEGNIMVNNGLMTINDGNDRGARIARNTLCNGRITAVHAEVRDNRLTCEGLNVADEVRKRVSGTAVAGPPAPAPPPPLPAPRNVRVIPLP